jgi:hypothetical protein
MAEATHGVTAGTEPLVRHAQSKMAAENGITNFMVDANSLRPIDYFVYIFNVGARSHRVTNGVLKSVYVPGVKPGQKYVLAFKLPNIVTQTYQDQVTEQLRTHGEDGRRVAMDLINPANMGIDQDFEINPADVVSTGADLSRWGLFWSLHEVPTEEELSKAIKRMEKHYRFLIQQADNFARTNNFTLIQDYHHLAADYFQYKSSWNTLVEIPEVCPLCGGTSKKGVAIHALPEGCGGVLDWKKAVSSGLKAKSDVPEDARWWKEEKKREV